jgi:hypothetical protein
MLRVIQFFRSRSSGRVASARCNQLFVVVMQDRRTERVHCCHPSADRTSLPWRGCSRRGVGGLEKVLALGPDSPPRSHPQSRTSADESHASHAHQAYQASHASHASHASARITHRRAEPVGDERRRSAHQEKASAPAKKGADAALRLAPTQHGPRQLKSNRQVQEP